MSGNRGLTWWLVSILSLIVLTPLLLPIAAQVAILAAIVWLLANFMIPNHLKVEQSAMKGLSSLYDPLREATALAVNAIENGGPMDSRMDSVTCDALYWLQKVGSLNQYRASEICDEIIDKIDKDRLSDSEYVFGSWCCLVKKKYLEGDGSYGLGMAWRDGRAWCDGKPLPSRRTN